MKKVIPEQFPEALQKALGPSCSGPYWVPAIYRVWLWCTLLDDCDLHRLAALDLAGRLRFTRVGCGVLCWMTASYNGWLLWTLLRACDLQCLAVVYSAG